MNKQVIVMRNDLGMRKGKMIVQGSHASLAVFTNRMAKRELLKMSKSGGDPSIRTEFAFDAEKDMIEWLESKFTKICVRVNSEEELHEIYNKAKDAGLPCSLIQDAGDTEFHGVPTYTCCGIGPANVDKINPVTGHLKLL